MDHHTDGDLTGFNIAAAASLLATGLLSWFYLIPRYVAVDPEQAFGLSPAFMPRLAAACIMLLAVLLLFRALSVRLFNRPATEEESEDGDLLCFGKQEIIYLAVFAGYSAAFMTMFQSAGFIITSSLALAGVMWLFRIRPHWLVIIVALSIPVMLQAALWYGLTVAMPGIGFR